MVQYIPQLTSSWLVLGKPISFINQQRGVPIAPRTTFYKGKSMAAIINNQVADTIRLLHETAQELEQKYLTQIIERNPNQQLTYIQYGCPLDKNAEPEHLLEVDDAIRRALNLGWNPKDKSDKVCRYSIFLWNSVASHYLYERTDHIQKEGESKNEQTDQDRNR